MRDRVEPGVPVRVELRVELGVPDCVDEGVPVCVEEAVPVCVPVWLELGVSGMQMLSAQSPLKQLLLLEQLKPLGTRSHTLVTMLQ